MEALIRDLKVAVRGLSRNPGFTGAAILCLALGIGANSAVFTLINSVLLRALPFEEPERIVMVWGQFLANDMERMPASGAEFLDYEEQVESFDAVAAVVTRYLNLTEEGTPERLVAARVSASLFPMLGAEPLHGRNFLPEEDRFGNEKVTILSHGLWSRRFGADPEIVGKDILLSDEPFRVVGVMKEDFKFKVGMFDHQLWIPVAINTEALPPRPFRGLQVVARLAPGVALEQAQAEMDTIASRWQRQYSDVYAPQSGWGIRLTPVQEEIVGDIRPALLLLMGTVALVLLIACANVANLLLVRASAREKEVALRSALGAGKGALVRQFLTESLVLSLAGGLLGLVFAWIGIQVLKALQPANLPRLEEVGLDGRVLLFTLVVALVTGILFGLAPALRAAKPDLQSTLKEGGKTSAQSGNRQWLKSSLVVAEVAVALVVLVGAGLLIKSFLRLQASDLGFDTDRVLTAQLFLSPNKYPTGEQQVAYGERLLERIRAVPGVESAAAVTGLPLEEVQFLVETEIEGHVSSSGEAIPIVDWRPVSPGYFDTLGMELLDGRPFGSQDHAGGAQVAVVDENLVERYWPGQNPLGKWIKLTTGQPGGLVVERRVVGVVPHVRSLSIEGDPRPQVYTPMAQSPFPFLSVVIRTASDDPLGVANPVREAVWAVDRDQPVDNVQTLGQIVSEASAGRRSFAALLGAFAAIALILATIGVYGVMAYAVSQRHREIGIRMALGARRSEVVQLVVLQGMTLAALGVVAGLVAAFLTSTYVSSQLYEVSATDPLTFVGVAVLLAGLAFLATFLPARRASKVDPMVSLRTG